MCIISMSRQAEYLTKVQCIIRILYQVLADLVLVTRVD